MERKFCIMNKKTLLLLSTIFFAVAIAAYLLYFASKKPSFIATAILTTCVGCIFNFLSKRR